MVTVVFRDSSGRPLAGALVSIAAAPGEILDIGMVADDRGEIGLTPSGVGDYEFVVFADGATRRAAAHITGTEERVAVVVGPPRS